MPASVTVDDNAQLVTVRGWGVLLMEELVEAQRQISEAPAFKPHFRELLDFVDVRESRLTPSGLHKMAATTPFNLDAPRAIVADSDVLNGLFLMYGVFSGSGSSRWRIFRRREDALKWLGAKP